MQMTNFKLRLLKILFCFGLLVIIIGCGHVYKYHTIVIPESGIEISLTRAEVTGGKYPIPRKKVQIMKGEMEFSSGGIDGEGMRPINRAGKPENDCVLVIIGKVTKGKTEVFWTIDQWITDEKEHRNAKDDMAGLSEGREFMLLFNVPNNSRKLWLHLGNSLAIDLALFLYGDKARDGRFIAYGDGTVMDMRTGLMWAARDNGYDINWRNAKNYCKNYRGGGYTDWRMPSLDELMGLYDADKTYQSECGSIFGRLNVHLTKLIRLSCIDLWGSDTHGPAPVSFCFHNRVQYWGGSDKGRALPVRSGKYDSVLPCPDGTEWNPDFKKCEPNKNVKKREQYKDGEDGVSRTRPGNHKPGENSPVQPEYKDGEDGTMRARPPK